MTTLQSVSSEYDIVDFVEQVYKFNSIAYEAKGVTNITEKELRSQFKVIKEEVSEISEAIELKDPVELLDGVVDTLVTVLGMAQQLEMLGFDVLGACKRVAEDNLAKYTNNKSVAEESKQDYLHKKATQVEVKYNSIEDVYVLVDVNGKIRKPINFKPTDLTEFVPSDFKWS